MTLHWLDALASAPTRPPTLRERIANALALLWVGLATLIVLGFWVVGLVTTINALWEALT